MKLSAAFYLPLLILSLAALACLTHASEAAMMELYVAPDGNDAWSGTLDRPNTAGSDGPFATISRAQAAAQLQGGIQRHVVSRVQVPGPATFQL